MNPELLAQFTKIVPIGLLSGLLAGAFGVGGGIISVPLVRHILGVSAHVAVGSTLAMILPTALVGAVNYLKEKKLLALLAFACTGPAVFGTIVSSAFSHYIHGKFLMLGLAGLMILVGLDFVSGFGAKLRSSGEAADAQVSDELKAHAGEDAKTQADESSFVLDKECLGIASIIGLIVGVLSGLLGIGGGFIMVPAFCYFLRLPLKIAFGTSLVVVALVALPGTLVHAYHGHVQLWVVIPMLLGSMPGAWIGSYFALKAKDRSLKIIFGSILLVLAILFAIRELNAAN